MDKKIRILLLENNAVDAEIIERELSEDEFDFTLKRVDNEKKFKNALEKFKPDVVLSDYSLPTYDGLSALSVIKEKNLDIPFIVVSGVISGESAIEYIGNGATDLVDKNGLNKLKPALKKAIKEAEEKKQLKSVENKLRESEKQFKLLFDFAPDAYYLNDLKGNLIDGNKMAEELTGYSKNELIGKSFLKLNMLLKKQIPKAAALLAKNALVKSTGPDEFILNRKDGSKVTVEIKTVPMKVKDQTLVLGIARNITERKLAEQERDMLLFDVGERVKELNCLYTVSQLSNETGRTVDDVLQGVADIIPPSWQYPKITRARITLNGREFLSDDFRESKWKQAADIMVSGKKAGKVEVFFTEEKPIEREDLFLKEERNLIDSLAVQLGTMVEHRHAQDDLDVRLRYEEGLADCSRALLDSTDDSVESGLGYLLKAVDVDRAYIFENFDDTVKGLCMRQIYEVCASGVEPEIVNPDYQSLPYSESYSRWQKELSNGNPVWGVTESLPEDEQIMLATGGIQSIIVIPIFMGKEWYGFIGFDDVRRRREWNNNDINLLRTASEMISTYIEKQKAEKELFESEERLKAFMESSTDGFALLDSELNMVYINDATMKTHPSGTRKDDIIGKNLVDIKPLFEDSDRYQKYLEVLNTGEPVFIDNVAGAGEISGMYYALRAFKVGEGIGLINIDITERKQMEEALRESEKQYHNLYDGVMVGVYRTMPDGQILNANQTLKYNEKGQSIDIKMEPKLSVWADAILLKRCITNVLNNAIKFLPAGGKIWVNTHYKDGMVEFIMKDNRLNIPEKNLKIIFDPFLMIESTPDVEIESTGMGLSITKNLVELMGGEIWAKGRKGGGLEIHFTMPVEPQEVIINDPGGYQGQ